MVKIYESDEVKFERKMMKIKKIIKKPYVVEKYGFMGWSIKKEKGQHRTFFGHSSVLMAYFDSSTIHVADPEFFKKAKSLAKKYGFKNVVKEYNQSGFWVHSGIR